MANLGDTLREIAALNEQRRQAIDRACCVPLPTAAPCGLAYAPGKRVLDLITGQEGVIVDGKAEHVITGGAG
jgi:hypothetical protein